MAEAKAQTQPMIPRKTPRSDRGNMSATTATDSSNRTVSEPVSAFWRRYGGHTDLSHGEDPTATHPLDSPRGDEHVHRAHVPSSTAEAGTEHEHEEGDDHRASACVVTTTTTTKSGSAWEVYI